MLKGESDMEVYCPYCNKKMRIMSESDRKPNGKKDVSYQCFKPVGGCGFVMLIEQ